MMFSTPKNLAIMLTCTIAVSIGILALTPLSAPQLLPGTDKNHHAFAFAALILPASFLSPRTLIWMLPMAVFYGGMIEVVQPYVGRFGEWLDFRADLLGLLLGMLMGLTLRRVAIRRLHWLQTSQS
jgi:VanZ family protein